MHVRIFLKSIKRAHKAALVKLYDANGNTGSFAITPAAMGRRALQNIALELLTVSNGTGCASRAKAHYDNADNMTDRVAALSCLANSTKPERDAVFADFYHQFKDYQLVVDKCSHYRHWQIGEQYLMILQHYANTQNLILKTLIVYVRFIQHLLSITLLSSMTQTGRVMHYLEMSLLN